MKKALCALVTLFISLTLYNPILDADPKAKIPDHPILEEIIEILENQWIYNLAPQKKEQIRKCVKLHSSDTSLSSAAIYCIGEDPYLALKEEIPEEVHLPSLVILENGIVHLQISSFFIKKYAFEKALANAAKSGLHKLIVDVRGNRGGFVTRAVELLNLLSPAANALVLTEKHAHNEPLEHRATHRGSFADWNIVVLVDAVSASASEIIAGTLQVWGFPIFGKKTFGKGEIQTPTLLSNGKQLLITTGSFYFPNGRNPCGEGVVPNFETDNPLEDAINYLNTFN